jgi:hypothetical protein
VLLFCLVLNTEICHAVICTTNLGLEYRSEQVPGNRLTYSINACCPCRAQPERYQLPLCGLRNAIAKVNQVKTQTNNALSAFVSINWWNDYHRVHSAYSSQIIWLIDCILFNVPLHIRHWFGGVFCILL